jgi:hypothetical protein
MAPEKGAKNQFVHSPGVFSWLLCGLAFIYFDSWLRTAFEARQA